MWIWGVCPEICCDGTFVMHASVCHGKKGGGELIIYENIYVHK